MVVLARPRSWDLDDLGGARWDVLRSSAAAGRGGAGRMGVVAGDGA